MFFMFTRQSCIFSLALIFWLKCQLPQMAPPSPTSPQHRSRATLREFLTIGTQEPLLGAPNHEINV